MKKNRYALFLAALLCAATSMTAQTIITSTTVSGNWTMAGSPYIIKTDFTIPGGQSLRIGPGVEVRFDSLYSITATGSLIIAGTAQNRVLLHARDTTGWANDSLGRGGWRGIYWPFVFTPDSSSIRYCDIRDGKSGYNVPHSNSNITGFFAARNVAISNLRFSHNQGNLFILSPYGNGNADSVLIDSSEFWNNNPVVSASLSSGVIQINNRGIIRNCSFHDNVGTAMVANSGTDLTLEDNQIYNNAQAAYSINLNNLYMRRNNVHHNTSGRTGAIDLRLMGAVIDNNFICNNKMILEGGGTCGLTEGGGAMRLVALPGGPQFLIRNNVFANNESDFVGGGLDLQDAKALIANNTIINNISASYGPGISTIGVASDITFRNNILWGNVSTGNVMTPTHQICMVSGGAARFNNNLMKLPVYMSFIALPIGFTITGDTTHNVITNAPGLMSATAGTGVSYNAGAANFSLLQASIAVNKGDTTGSPATPTDLAGSPRFYGNKIDIGAYELQKAGTNTGTGNAPASQQITIPVFPNPAAGEVHVQLPAATGRVVLLDAAGRIAWQVQVAANALKVPVNALSAGCYKIVWVDEGIIKGTAGVVVQR